MYKRLIILTVIIAVALGGMTVLGYHAIDRWSEALRWKQFAEVAELINQDVKLKLDKFMETEENRPYYHYQFYYVHEDVTNQESIVLRRSPLAGIISNSFAYGQFQIDENANLLTANDNLLEIEGASFYNTTIHVQNQLNRRNVTEYLLPLLRDLPDDTKDIKTNTKPSSSQIQLGEQIEEATLADEQTEKVKTKKAVAAARRFVRNYKSFEPRKRPAQVLEQQRGVFENNAVFNSIEAIKQLKASENQMQQKLPEVQAQDSEYTDRLAQNKVEEDDTRNIRQQSARSQRLVSDRIGVVRNRGNRATSAPGTTNVQTNMQIVDNDVVDFRDSSGLNNETLQLNFSRVTQSGLLSTEKVKIHIGPFEPVIAGGKEGEGPIFDGQVFMVRNVRIDGRSFWQGFKFDQQKLLEEVKESATRFVGKRKGMDFKIPQTKNTVVDDEDIAWEAVLDFGFGHLVVYLKETVPELIVQQASQLRSWYFSIVVIVLIAVTLGLLSLWRFANAQIKLAEKKDDFISAVSHELRTPLTSIRMYSEMLEKNWVKSEDKLAEYYKNMRQESERLSRLIENVLDFSRIQKGRKKFSFSVGNLNESVAIVVEMMAPYAQQYGFTVQTELGQLDQMTFDNDAVKQILVNLLDNAIKYARNAQDKTITVRTKSDTDFVLIEVEDHGPGVPHRQRKKIFEEFYRLGSETTRETTGTGLGLALVKKFAQAHNGFVEILSAKPAGSIFRVGLAMQS